MRFIHALSCIGIGVIKFRRLFRRSIGGVPALFFLGTALPLAAQDITSQILANQDVVLNGNAIVMLPAKSTTTYTGVISGFGTLNLRIAGGTTAATGTGAVSTLIITRTQTFSLPTERLVQRSTQSHSYTGFEVDITGTNAPVVTINPGVTLQFGSGANTDSYPNIYSGSDAFNPISVTQNQVNLNNILNNGLLILCSGNGGLRLGRISGTGNVVQIASSGTFFLQYSNSFSGILYTFGGGCLGISHATASLPRARAIINMGSLLVGAPGNQPMTIRQNIYESHYGDDINMNIGHVTMTGIYSYTDTRIDNRAYPNPVQLDRFGITSRALLNPKLNEVIFDSFNGINVHTGTYLNPTHASGNNGSYRGINIEGGTFQWGDGTTATFFLPTAPSPAAPGIAKNAYINLRNGATLLLNYNGRYKMNVGITGGGGGPHSEGSPGRGNVTLASTLGNYAIFTQPQNYNGVTTIGSSATLQLGNGGPVELGHAYNNSYGITSYSTLGTYSGDSSLLTGTNNGVTNRINLRGTLIIDNTETPITLSNLYGPGKIVQQSRPNAAALAGTIDGLEGIPGDIPALTLEGTNTYTGGTLIAERSTVLVGSLRALGSGDVLNQGTLATTDDFHSIRLYAGSYTQSTTGNLVLAVSGTLAGVTFDQMRISGIANLSGKLTLDFSSGYVPASPVTLKLLVTKGGITGAFLHVTSNSAAVKILGTALSADHKYLSVQIGPK